MSDCWSSNLFYAWYGSFCLINCLVVLARSHFFCKLSCGTLNILLGVVIIVSFWSFIESKLTFYSFIGTYLKDAIDLLQGHYIVSVSRDMTPSSQKGGLETVAVSTSQMAISFVHIIFRQLIISLQLVKRTCMYYVYIGMWHHLLLSTSVLEFLWKIFPSSFLNKNNFYLINF